MYLGQLWGLAAARLARLQTSEATAGAKDSRADDGNSVLSDGDEMTVLVRARRGTERDTRGNGPFSRL